MMVEVFKTNVEAPDESARIIEELLQRYPQNRINFDLSDCDRILRVEGENIHAGGIIELMEAIGYICEVLP
ncbi:MAG TPA: hypothetical protein VGE25_15075 [Sediminibacterium sp.]|jgi:hypothetical protein